MKSLQNRQPLSRKDAKSPKLRKEMQKKGSLRILGVSAPSPLRFLLFTDAGRSACAFGFPFWLRFVRVRLRRVKSERDKCEQVAAKNRVEQALAIYETFDRPMKTAKTLRELGLYYQKNW